LGLAPHKAPQQTRGTPLARPCCFMPTPRRSQTTHSTQIAQIAQITEIVQIT
jgi:hypothetical protein